MKNNRLKIGAAFLFMILISYTNLYSQINYATSFDGCNAATCSGWTISGGMSPSITSSSSSGYSPCNTSSAKSNIYDNSTYQTTTLTSGIIGVSNGTAVTFSFNGKAITYSTGAAAAADACTFQGFWSTDGTTWTPLNSVNNVSSTSCNTHTFSSFTPACGQNVYVRIVATRNSGDFWAVMDDISVTQSAIGPSGTITRNCVGLGYDAQIVVSDLDGSTGVNISIGATTYHTNVGLGTYTIPNLSGSNTVNVTDASDVCRGFSQTLAACNICLDAPALPTDECASAPLIDLSQPFVGSTNCAYTVSAGSPSACGHSINNDSWMSFIAGDTDVEIEVTVGSGASCTNGIQLAVFSGTCGSLTLVPGSCSGPGSYPDNAGTTFTWNFSGMTIGATYYVRIDGYAGDLCDYYFEPISGVVITPDNDLCADAMTLNCGDSDIASNILATNTDAPSACTGGGVNPTGKGIWYTFIGTGQEVTISTDNPGTNFNSRINVYSASVAPYCSNLNCVGGADGAGNGASYTFTTTTGTNYYVYVSGVGAAEGQFELSLDCVVVPPCNANAGTWD